MKVLHVSPSYFPATQFGGPIQSVHLLNKQLAKNGIEVDVFTTNAGLDSGKFNARSWQNLDGVRVKYFSFIGYVHYNFSISLFISLLKFVKHYDVVHITAVWNFPVWAASFACWWHKKPYIISPRGTIYPETIAIKSTTVKKMYYKLVSERCLKKASCLHFTAKDEEQSVKNYLSLNTPSVVVANGINLKEFEEPAGKRIMDEPYLLFLGRINYKKGLDLLYKAFAQITNQFPTLKLVIAGPDNDGYKKELEILAQELNIGHKIVYTGEVTGSEKVSLYKNAQAFVLSSYSENFGMSVVEALACGCPVAISDKVGIAEELLAHGAALVSSLEVFQIQKTIVEIIENEELRKLLAENGTKAVKSLYSIESVAEKFEGMYEKLI